LRRRGQTIIGCCGGGARELVRWRDAAAGGERVEWRRAGGGCTGARVREWVAGGEQGGGKLRGHGGGRLGFEIWMNRVEPL
jgi:hypothetical protein